MHRSVQWPCARFTVVVWARFVMQISRSQHQPVTLRPLKTAFHLAQYAQICAGAMCTVYRRSLGSFCHADLTVSAPACDLATAENCFPSCSICTDMCRGHVHGLPS